jgi:ABC-type nitrate/sulfonate/bicarbonate transport system ATPase subunit
VNRLIDARSLAKSFGSLEVLADVSLSLAEAETVGILGPSGCGKTTLLRILLGLEPFDRGELTGRLDRSGYLPQETLLFPWKTVLENAELPLQIRGVPRDARRSRVAAELPRFGLEQFSGAYPHQLSGGMRQRAALLRALLADGESLVLDEPFGALDTITRHRLQDWLVSLIDELGRSLLFVTHDLEESLVLSDRVLTLSDRPTIVTGEQAIDLTSAERVDRLGTRFMAARDRVLRSLRKESPIGIG